jgi:hypothetical protein
LVSRPQQGPATEGEGPAQGPRLSGGAGARTMEDERSQDFRRFTNSASNTS